MQPVQPVVLAPPPVLHIAPPQPHPLAAPPALRIDRACLRSMTKLTGGEFDAWLDRREARHDAEIVRVAALDAEALDPEDVSRWLRRRQARRVDDTASGAASG